MRWQNKPSHTHGCRARRTYLALARLSCTYTENRLELSFMMCISVRYEQKEKKNVVKNVKKAKKYNTFLTFFEEKSSITLVFKSIVVNGQNR